MYVYLINPVDFHWEHLSTVRDTIVQILGQNPENGIDIAVDGFDSQGLSEFLQAWRKAKQLARSELDFDGKIQGEAHVFWLPDDCAFSPGFVFKQENNGATHVISPQPLPHLEGLSV